MAQKRKKLAQPSFTGNGHLEQSPINLLSLREHARNQIKNILQRVNGRTKHLIWDNNLVGPLNVIISTKLLHENGITLRTPLDHGTIVESDCDAIIYFTYPIVSQMKIISKQILEHSRKNRHKNFYVYLLPRKTYLCERALKESGVFGSIHFGELPIEWFPMDKDVLTCALNRTLTSSLSGDLSNLFDIAKALVKLQAVFGKFPIVRAKGDFSCGVIDIMKRLMCEDSDLYKFDENSQISEISQCILIDRTVDMITPLLTPRTYEGLLDETIGINDGLIKMDKQYLGKSQQKQRTKTNELTIVLNSSDNIYKQIRDINFRYLGTILSTLLSAIQSGYDARHDAKSTKELNHYMKKFKNLHANHQLVEQHVHLAEYVSQKFVKKMNYKRRVEHEMALLNSEYSIMSDDISAEEYLEELIGRNENIETVLRFMILCSICQGGISSKKYDIIKKEIIHAYGIKHLLTIDLLEQYSLITRSETMMKILKAQTGYFNWNNVRKNFQLCKSIDELHDMYEKNRAFTQSQEKSFEMDISGKESNISGLVNDPSCLGIYDLNLVGSGYAPLSARLVEAATRPHGWKGIESKLELLPGKQYLEDKLINSLSNNSNKNKQFSENKMNINNVSGTENPMKQASKHKTVLVFFVGGVTYSEITAIRMLENRTNTPWKFIVGTTDIANGFKIVDGFVDQSFKTIDDNSYFSKK